MKIYKFKDLTDEKKHFEFYQIVLQSIFWCAKPDSLNDENEFKFELGDSLSANIANLLSQVVRKCRGTNSPTSYVLKDKELKKIAVPIIDNLINDCRNEIGVACFSSKKTDDHLWNEYGGKGNGVRIEINIPDELIGKLYHPVDYVPERIFPIDSFLESFLSQEGASEIYRYIFLTKTKKWDREEEMRYISKCQEVNIKIDGYISEVLFGAQVPADTLKQVKAKIVKHCNTNNIRITKL